MTSASNDAALRCLPPMGTILPTQYARLPPRRVTCGTGCGAGGIANFALLLGRAVPFSARLGGVLGIVCARGARVGFTKLDPIRFVGS